MKVCVLLVCALCVCWRTEAQSRSYLITAPVSLRLDSVDSVLLQLFGFTDEVTVYVFLKTSMAPDHVVLAREVVSLNAQNQHQAVAKVRLFPDQLERSVQQVVLHVQSAEINRHLTVPVSRSNGFLFIQTDKPLYTPHQSVKVRAFSLNQELRPANRSVFLTFKDPDQTTVDTAEMIDVNNGLPSLQNPFKIPVKPKLGIWSIEASYSNDFTTTARTDFEVKEYVLPSFSILVEPEANYISYSHFSRFTFKVSAHYLHGAPVAEGEVFLRYGYVSGKNPPVVIPNSITRDRLSSDGDLDVTVNMQKLLSKHEGPKDLDSLLGKYLYIAVLLEESTGAITQEAEFASVKFVKSPYTLSLVSTPPFIKPGLPYNIQLLVKDHLGKPVSRVGVRLVERQLFREGQDSGHMPCPASSTSQPDGLALFICNPPVGGVRAVLTFETTDPALPATSQARLRLEAVAYHSPNRRYLYIDAPLLSRGLQVGRYANIEVYSATPAYLHVKALSYLVLSKGKLVHFGTQLFVSSVDNKQNLNFLVTAAMVPSVRLLVFYIVDGEGVRELVADSVWLDVKDTCVNGLRTDVSLNRRSYKPKENLRLDIRTNQDGLVALTAADSALFTLRPNYRDPVTMVQRHLEASDQGCGGGGGRDNADVFHLAGLTFITNANAQAHSSSAVCTAAVRVKRALSNEAKTKKVESYGMFKSCCQRGLMYIPKIMTCEKFSQQLRRKQPGCRSAFKECCEFAERHLDLDRDLVLGRHDMGTDFDVVPSLVRSYFPESWMWEVQPVRSGSTSISRSLPDSLTTWEVRAVGVFFDGVCVAEPVQVSVSLPLSVDVPLPYQVVRGEQVELRGSVYNQEPDSTKFCVTLTLGPEFCLLQSQPVPQRAGLHSTACTWSNLPAGGVGAVAFTLMGLEPGEHTLTFTLRTPRGHRDIVEKKLRVVPEGVRQEMLSGGTLDPRGLYGLERRTVLLRNQLPPNMVPNTAVQRVLTITGEVLGDVLSLATSEDGLRQLVNLPVGSAEAELGGLLPLVQVYQYLETTRNWEVLGGAGGGAQKNAAEMRRKIRQGVVSISSFRRGDFSYSPWVGRESSTWLTALVVRTLSAVDQVVSVDHQSLSHSVAWLIRSTQQGDGSFTEKSSFRGNKVLAAGGHPVDQSVYLTSFVLIALKRATSIKDQILQLRFHDSSMDAAASYISERARDLRSVHVRAVACYALTLHDPDSVAAAQLMGSLERVARQKGLPAVLRYWQESHVTADWLRPDQSSGQTVETTALVLLTMLLKFLSQPAGVTIHSTSSETNDGRIPYANPILAWLTQDQHYGEGFYSIQDTTLTLEALTEYSRTVSRAVINQDINIRLGRRGELQHVTLSQSRPVATPMQVQTNDDITVSTGYGSGVSTVKLKTVYYQTTPSLQSSCNFHLNIELLAPQEGSSTMRAPHLVACAKYRPPPNEVHTESSLTLMKIQLPTGVEAHLEDLRQFRDLEDPIVSHFELQGNVVIIQLDTVPSDMFLCVGFRVRVAFKVGRATESVFTVSEPQDRGSLCTKQFSYQEQKLQRLCEAEQCQCMTGACATFRGTIDSTLTAANRSAETCRPHVRYAYKVSVRSAAAEGDFMTFTATVVEVLKNSDTALEAVSSGTEVELVQKATCSDVVVQVDKQYLVMGAAGSEVRGQHGSRYRLPLDSDALVERWPTDCSSPECLDYISQLNDFSLNLQLLSCP